MDFMMSSKSNLEPRYRKVLIGVILLMTICVVTLQTTTITQASGGVRFKEKVRHSSYVSKDSRDPTTAATAKAVAIKRHCRLNSTLGFERILYINVPWAYDRGDAMALQASLSELDIDELPGTPIDELQGKSLSPSLSKSERTFPQMAYFASHMSAWEAIIKNNWQNALIIESDSAWDTDIREIMGYYVLGLEKILHKQELAPDYKKSARQDPYLTQYWDLLQFGACGSSQRNKDLSIEYYDPYTVSGMKYYGKKLQDRRVIRYGNTGACSTAYALSKGGAVKLLQSASMDIDKPIDLLMAQMSGTKNFHSFTSFPSLFARARYVNGLSVTDRNSDNRDVSEDGAQRRQDKSDWKSVRERVSEWIVKEALRSVKLKKMALLDLKDHLYGLDERPPKKRDIEQAAT